MVRIEWMWGRGDGKEEVGVKMVDERDIGVCRGMMKVM